MGGELKNYRPGEPGAPTNADPPISTTVPRPPIRQKVDKNYYVEMPKIPGVEPRSTPPPPPHAKPAAPSGDAVANDAVAEIMQAAGGIYAGPTTKRDLVPVVKRLAKLVAAIVLVAVAASFAMKTIGRVNQSESDAPSPRPSNVPSARPQTTP